MRAILAPLWNNAYLLMTLTCLFWAGNSVIGRAARDLVPPVGLAFWRWVLAFTLLIGVAWPYLKRDREILLKQWRWVVALGALGVGAFNTLLYSGLQYTTAINALLMQSAQPPLIMLMAFFLFRDRTGPVQIVGVLLSLVGVLVIVAGGDIDVLIHLRLNPGDAIILGAMLLWVLYSVLLRFRPPVHPLSFLAATFGIAILFITPFYVMELMAGRRIVPVAESFATIAYVGIFPSLLAYAFFNRGVELLGPGRAGVFLNLMPVFGSLLAIALLGERFTTAHAVGIGLIGIGLLLTRKA
ncbi:DMT family transporter [Sphingoaurantiacus capsulatus]|uniref:DMT family transporter n=1 Tax=Sphingoaurantiacus capsulatus TaxID=1771310 RepID=A0ABV7X980_9SPHN